MLLKHPPVYDISHYEEIPDFTKVSPRPALFITKATEGTTYRDDKFIRFFAGMSQIGVPRGCYHFFRKAYNSITQAQHFTNTVRSYVTKNDLLILDIEEGGETAAQIQQWFVYIQSEFPDNQLMIYSRKNLLDPISMTSVQKDFFRDIPVWIAGYPTFPDLYNTPPASYIPDQNKWGRVVLWQYSDKGVIAGIQGNTDINWIDPIFLAQIGDALPPPPPSGDVLLFEREYFPGAIERQYRTITTHGEAIYNLTEVETAKVEKFFVSPQLSSRQYVPKFLEDYDLHFAINCGGWTSPPLVPTGYNASEGQPYGKSGNEETIYISKDNVFSLIRPSIVWNAFSFQDRLIKDGIIPANNSIIKKIVKIINKIIKPAGDIRGRTAIGYTRDQAKVFLLTVDGGDQYSNEGMNYQECADLLLKIGCYQGFMLDGGGSTAKVVEDHGAKIIGLPSGEDLVVQYGAQLRRVLNIFGLLMKSGAVVIPPTGDEMYSMTPINNDTRIRTNHSTFDAVLRSVAADVVVSGDALWIASVDGNEVKAGDTWLLVTKIAGTYISPTGWMARIHKGATICDNFTESTAPPLSNPVNITITTDDVVNLTVNGIPYHA